MSRCYPRPDSTRRDGVGMCPCSGDSEALAMRSPRTTTPTCRRCPTVCPAPGGCSSTPSRFEGLRRAAAAEHPSTWSAIRRTKDKQDRYLTSADPTRDEASSVWGVSVLVTTQIDPSVGVLLDTTKFGRVLMREPLSIRTGLNEDDFTRNIMRFICEERISLAIERPAAVSIITGLPTS